MTNDGKTRKTPIHHKSTPKTVDLYSVTVEKVRSTMSNVPIIAGTLQTDPRSGGIKRSSGVNVLPIVSEGQF